MAVNFRSTLPPNARGKPCRLIFAGGGSLFLKGREGLQDYWLRSLQTYKLRSLGNAVELEPLKLLISKLKDCEKREVFRRYARRRLP